MEAFLRWSWRKALSRVVSKIKLVRRRAAVFLSMLYFVEARSILSNK